MWSKRFVRDHLRYVDEIMCAAARVIEAVREHAKGSGLNRNISREYDIDGAYDAMHVRRGDFQYPPTQLPAEQLHSLSPMLTKGATLYVATDERDKSFFEVFRKDYDLVFLDDFLHVIPDVNTNVRRCTRIIFAVILLFLLLLSYLFHLVLRISSFSYKISAQPTTVLRNDRSARLVQIADILRNLVVHLVRIRQSHARVLHYQTSPDGIRRWYHGQLLLHARGARDGDEGAIYSRTIPDILSRIPNKLERYRSRNR